MKTLLSSCLPDPAPNCIPKLRHPSKSDQASPRRGLEAQKGPHSICAAKQSGILLPGHTHTLGSGCRTENSLHKALLLDMKLCGDSLQKGFASHKSAQPGSSMRAVYCARIDAYLYSYRLKPPNGTANTSAHTSGRLSSQIQSADHRRFLPA